MRKKMIGISALALGLALILTLMPSCGGDTEQGPQASPTSGITPTPGSTATPRATPTPTPATELPPVEIREYEGKDLSSIDDFRENSIRGPQYIDIESYELKIMGLVDNPSSYTYDTVIDSHEHYKKVVTLNCVEGWSVTILWEGVLLRDLMEEAKPSPDAKVVIFHAYDGYTTSLPLDYIMDNDIIMAHKMNDVTIPPERGFPFELVAESKWGYKWIKWITEIELSDGIDYRGFWESRGYSNEGNLDEPHFDF